MSLTLRPGLPGVERRVYDSFAVVLSALYIPVLASSERFVCGASRWELERVSRLAVKGADHFVEE
jgi:hypothetical protein